MSIHADVSRFCAAVGADPLLVQGAGGNVSWKEHGTLWVKASGKWLSDAAQSDVFVPVDLIKMREALAAGHFDAVPVALDVTGLRPSIETVLHALMPQRFVAHLHAVDALAFLVRQDAGESVVAVMEASFGAGWAIVEYQKPGAALAKSVAHALALRPGARVILMRNHGVVLGADSMDELQSLLERFIVSFRSITTESEDWRGDLVEQPPGLPGYQVIAGSRIQSLAVMPARFNLLQSGWALYPDHVVFLGAKPIIHETFKDWQMHVAADPAAVNKLIFIQGVAVYAESSFSAAQLAQLNCYAEVLARVPHDAILKSLTQDEIDDLLNWDAEKHRLSLAK